MRRPTPTTLALMLALCTALALRLGAGLWWDARLNEDQQFFFGDSHTYWVLGQQIARGEPYYYGTPDKQVFRTPGYPLLLAALFKIAGDDPPVLWARALSAVLATLAVGGVFWIGNRLFDERAALLAAWIAAVYPGAISLGAFVLSEAPFCVLLLMQLALAIVSWQTMSKRRSIGLSLLAGVAAGAATLVRPSWLLFTPFSIGTAILFAPDKQRHVVLGIVAMFGLCLVMSPWWVRNYRLTGHFIATTLQTGASLYDGLSEKADGSSDMSFEPQFEAAERAAETSAPQAETFEYRLDRRLREAAINWAREHPGRAVELAGIKFLRMWNIWPNEAEFRSLLLRSTIALTYTPILILALLAIWRFSRSGWPYVILWLPAVYLTLIHMVFIGSLRYREPVMLPLIVLAAGELAVRWGWTAKPSDKAPIASIAR